MGFLSLRWIQQNEIPRHAIELTVPFIIESRRNAAMASPALVRDSVEGRIRISHHDLGIIESVLRDFCTKPVSKEGLLVELKTKGLAVEDVQEETNGMERHISTIIDAESVYANISNREIEAFMDNPDLKTYIVKLAGGFAFLAVLSGGTAIGIAKGAMQILVERFGNIDAELSKHYAILDQNKYQMNGGDNNLKVRAWRGVLEEHYILLKQVSRIARTLAALGEPVNERIKKIISGYVKSVKVCTGINFSFKVNDNANNIDRITITPAGIDNAPRVIIPLGSYPEDIWQDLIKEHPFLPARELVKLSVADAGWTANDQIIKVTPPPILYQIKGRSNFPDKSTLVQHILPVNGGIDLDRARMRMNVHKAGPGIKIRFDLAMVERIKRDGFEGVDFQITKIKFVNDLPFLLGLERFD